MFNFIYNKKFQSWLIIITCFLTIALNIHGIYGNNITVKAYQKEIELKYKMLEVQDDLLKLVKKLLEDNIQK